MKHRITWSSLLLLLTFIISMVATTNEADAQRRRSFGGFRRSPSYAPSRPPSSGGSSGSYRSRTSPSYRDRYSTSPSTGSSSGSSRGGSSSPRTSFGGRRLSSSQEYTSSYGIPRRTEQLKVPSGTSSGMAQNYTVHRYGGAGDGFMMGYLTGSSSWLWSMPFHPAFYYTRPYYVPGANGQMEVYPPTFSWTKLIIVLLVAGGIVFVVVSVLRSRRGVARNVSRSSFS